MSKGEKVDDLMVEIQVEEMRFKRSSPFFAPFPLLFFKYLHLVVGPIRP